MLEIGHS